MNRLCGRSARYIARRQPRPHIIAVMALLSCRSKTAYRFFNNRRIDEHAIKIGRFAVTDLTAIRNSAVDSTVIVFQARLVRLVAARGLATNLKSSK
jgi:hypothetical protein